MSERSCCCADRFNLLGVVLIAPLAPAAASAIVRAAMISVVTLPTIVRWLLRGVPLGLPQEKPAVAPA